MRQKATWFIPGILLTLLMGLLWAMPAFAADAGEVSFLNGGDEIEYISLNGFAADGGFTAQVEDQDLNAPTKYDPDNAGRIQVNDSRVGTIDWTNLADSNNDGKININDIELYGSMDGDDEDTGRTGLTLDVTNGTLNAASAAGWLEFRLNEQTTIGAYVSKHTQGAAAGTAVLGVADTVAIAFQSDASLAGNKWADVIADTDGDGELDDQITATAGAATLTVTVEGTGDAMEVRATGTGVDITTMITLSYDTVLQGMGHLGQIGLVTVDSGGGDRTSIALKETSATSGRFQAMVEICDSNDSDCAISQDVPASVGDRPGMVTFPVDSAGDTVSVRYSDASPKTTRSENISLDTDSPAFSEMSPASGTAGKIAEPDVSFEVTDAGSGISSDEESDGFDDSIRLIAALFEADSGNSDAFSGPIVLTRTDDLTIDEITDGFSAEVRLREGDDESDELDAGTNNEYEIRWWAVAVDQAGNTGVSDSNSDTECAYDGSALTDTGNDLITALMALDDSDEDDVKSCDPNVIRVDEASPELLSATTGVFFDDDEDNDEGTGSPTSIVARFDEALDCDSVAAGDFEVDGSAPNDVFCKGSNVYLSVDEMDSSATPNVEVVKGAISDRAGNLIGADQIEVADDGVPAGLTVTITGTGEGDRVVTKGSITITVSSDERLKSRPTVAIQQIGDNYELGTDAGNTAAPTGNANEWSITASLSNAGLYNVYVTAEDRESSGESKAGVNKDLEKNIKDGKAFLFEVDKGVPAPTFTPATEGKTDNAGVFVRANFGDEGKEYGLEALDDKSTEATDDDTRDHTTVPGDVSTDFDTHGTLKIVSATFNDEDVAGDVITRDDVLFVYRPGNLSNGEHTFKIKVMDNAGNEDEFSTTFTKVDKAAYKLNLNPGPNLVSFPANPADGDVNAVFGGEGNDDIMTVLTYDNGTGLWQTAVRGADGTLSGDLTSINGTNAYWVVADGVVTVSTLLEGSENFSSTPPHITVAEGWNLVGVVDTDQSAAGTDIADYFANVDAEVVYGYDSFDSRLVRQGAGDDVQTGKGYWVFVNKAGIIIP